jgi:magnesium-transporting ATPase (P-type)
MHTSQSTYWAFVIAAQAGIYAALASLWPTLFQPEVVKHGPLEDSRYRIGWAVHWRLPPRAAVAVTLLASIPILAVIFLQGWPVVVVLAVSACVTVTLWFVSPPGMKLLYTEQTQANGKPVVVLQSSKRVAQSIITFTALGLVPSLAIGAILYWLLAGLVRR